MNHKNTSVCPVMCILYTLHCKLSISTHHFTAVILKGDLFYCQLNKTQGRGKSGDLFSTTNSHSAQLPPPPLFAILGVSGIPVHGHNSGSGALNIEGNSIWPCSSDGTYGCTTCSSGASCHINLLRIIFYWEINFLSWYELHSQTVLTVLLDVRVSTPSCWGPW